MKALMLKQYMQLEYVDVPVPSVGADDVSIQVKAVGICGSDIHGIDGRTGRRIPPIIMGHEAAGVITEVGANVADWKKGDRVTFESTIYCGKCYYCRRGEINLCDNRRVLGVSCADYRQHGAFAEYVAVPQHILHRLPDAVSFEQASLVEPMSVGVHGVSRLPITSMDTAVVVGVGTIGLMALQALRVAGAGRIIAVDLDDYRLGLSRKLGADDTLNSGKVDAVAEVLKMTGGRGADLAVEAVGIKATLNLATQCLERGGNLSLIGNLDPTADFLYQSVVTRELTLWGSCSMRHEYAACLQMIARGAVNVDPLIDAVAPLSEGASWFSRLYKTEPGLLKVVLTP